MPRWQQPAPPWPATRRRSDEVRRVTPYPIASWCAPQIGSAAVTRLVLVRGRASCFYDVRDVRADTK